MVGACIPVLRVLVRDLRSTRQQCYQETDDASQLPDPSWPGWKVDILASKDPSPSYMYPSPSPCSANAICREKADNDDGSEKSICQAAPTVQRRRQTDNVVHTEEVTVETRSKSVRERSHDVISNDHGYELETIRSQAR